MPAPVPDQRIGTTRIGYGDVQAANGAFDSASLMNEVAASALSQQPTIGVVNQTPAFGVAQFVFAAGISEADLIVLDQIIAAHAGAAVPFAKAKTQKLADIKFKTAALIAAGSFEYPPASGKLFGMSEISQLNITGAFNSRNEGSFAYPVVFFVKSDLDSVSLADAAAVEAFHAAAVTAIRAIRDGGAALKAQLIAAGTIEAVSAIVDNR